MSFQIVKFTSLSCLLSLSISCSNGKSNGTPAADDANSPSQPTEQQQVEPQSLPDTAFASVEAMKYKVEVLDTSVSGDLSTLRYAYDDAPGAFTFRKDQRRDASFGGRVKGQPTEIAIDWAFTTDQDLRDSGVGRWGGGSGWTGQPLYVEWPDSCIERFKERGTINADFGKREIMVGSLASKIYFINFDTGRASRQPIPTTNPIKGTISLDPTLNGNLYFGQGVPAERPWGCRAIDLYKHEVTFSQNEDPKAQRRWAAYDSSPLRLAQFLFWPGENGTIYKFTVAPGSLKLHSTLRYTIAGTAPGVESSMSVYRNYGYLADNHGNIICINLNTLRPVWRYDLKDDTDATPVMAEENGRPYIYVGSEIDLQDAGFANFVKLDGLTGQPVWEARVEGRRKNLEKKHFDGGFYATALLGTGNCSDLVFSNVVANTDGQNGDFIALDRKDGKIVYRTPLRHYAWSSPVGFLNENDELYVFTADCIGNAYIIEGRTGRIITRRQVGSNFESSPVVVDSSLVVGSRGDKIYKLTLK